MKQEFDAKVAGLLGRLGYSRLKHRVFKAPWSSNVIEHIVYLEWKEKYVPRIAVDIGIRHREAESFAATMIRRLGPWPLRDLLDLGAVSKYGCLIQFSLGNLCSWPFSWSLDPVEMGIEACAKEIIDCLQSKLLPLVGEIKSDGSMYEFLTQTQIEELQPGNAAVRAAEAMFIGKRLNYPQSKVVSDIEPFRVYITSQIDRLLTVEDYLAEVWSNA